MTYRSQHCLVRLAVAGRLQSRKKTKLTAKDAKSAKEMLAMDSY